MSAPLRFAAAEIGKHVCPQCREEKPFTAEFFPADKKRKHGLSSWCRPCSRRKKIESGRRTKAKDPKDWRERWKVYQRTYKEKHPERVAEYLRRRNLRAYGLVPEEYDRLLAEQNGACALCKLPAESLWRAFAVDHDHRTGAVRGLLCHRCNLALGGFNDDPDQLREAIRYLEKPR